MLTFKHKPCLGDIIYSLPAVRAVGGGLIYLDPRFHGTPPRKYWLKHDNPQDIKNWINKFSLLIPLLERQEYVEKAKIYAGEKFDYDLDSYFHCGHMSGRKCPTIVDAHFMGLNLQIKPLIPWLICPNNSLKEQGLTKPIILINNGHWEPSAPVDLSFLHDLNNFKDLIWNCSPGRFPGIGIPRKVESLIEWLELIDGCEMFIGNQSFPLSLAVGLGKKRMFLECTAYPNCTFRGEDEFVITNDHNTNYLAMKRLFRNFHL